MSLSGPTRKHSWSSLTTHMFKTKGGAQYGEVVKNGVLIVTYNDSVPQTKHVEIRYSKSTTKGPRMELYIRKDPKKRCEVAVDLTFATFQWDNNNNPAVICVILRDRLKLCLAMNHDRNDLETHVSHWQAIIRCSQRPAEMFAITCLSGRYQGPAVFHVKDGINSIKIEYFRQRVTEDFTTIDEIEVHDAEIMLWIKNKMLTFLSNRPNEMYERLRARKASFDQRPRDDVIPRDDIRSRDMMSRDDMAMMLRNDARSPTISGSRTLGSRSPRPYNDQIRHTVPSDFMSEFMSKFEQDDRDVPNNQGYTPMSNQISVQPVDDDEYLTYDPEMMSNTQQGYTPMGYTEMRQSIIVDESEYFSMDQPINIRNQQNECSEPNNQCPEPLRSGYTPFGQNRPAIEEPEYFTPDVDEDNESIYFDPSLTSLPTLPISNPEPPLIPSRQAPTESDEMSHAAASNLKERQPGPMSMPDLRSELAMRLNARSAETCKEPPTLTITSESPTIIPPTPPRTCLSPVPRPPSLPPRTGKEVVRTPSKQEKKKRPRKIKKNISETPALAQPSTTCEDIPPPLNVAITREVPPLPPDPVISRNVPLPPPPPDPVISRNVPPLPPDPVISRNVPPPPPPPLPPSDTLTFRDIPPPPISPKVFSPPIPRKSNNAIDVFPEAFVDRRRSELDMSPPLMSELSLSRSPPGLPPPFCPPPEPLPDSTISCEIMTFAVAAELIRSVHDRPPQDDKSFASERAPLPPPPDCRSPQMSRSPPVRSAFMDMPPIHSSPPDRQAQIARSSAVRCSPLLERQPIRPPTSDNNIGRPPLQPPPSDRPPLRPLPMDRHPLQPPPSDRAPLPPPPIDRHPLQPPPSDRAPLQPPPSDRPPLQPPPSDRLPLQPPPSDRPPLRPPLMDRPPLPPPSDRYPIQPSNRRPIYPRP